MTKASTFASDQAPPKRPNIESCQMAIGPLEKVLYRDIEKEGNLLIKDTFPFPILLETPAGTDQAEDGIQISIEDKQRLYSPWRFSVIIKAIGAKLNHKYLKAKLTDMWKVKEMFPSLT